MVGSFECAVCHAPVPLWRWGRDFPGDRPGWGLPDGATALRDAAGELVILDRPRCIRTWRAEQDAALREGVKV